MSKKKKRIRNLERRVAYLSDMLDIVVEQQSSNLTQMQTIEQKIDDIEQEIDGIESAFRRHLQRESQANRLDRDGAAKTYTYIDGARTLPRQSNVQVEFENIKQQLAYLESMVRHYIALYEQNRVTTTPTIVPS